MGAMQHVDQGVSLLSFEVHAVGELFVLLIVFSLSLQTSVLSCKTVDFSLVLEHLALRAAKLTSGMKEQHHEEGAGDQNKQDDSKHHG